QRGVEPFHLLLLADPQILDQRSYPGRNPLLKWLGEKITDNFARKSWRLALRTDPKTIIFLGDLLGEYMVVLVDKRVRTRLGRQWGLNY
ncbi:hypothetical protein BT69DRAFT_1230927, partial [Atractiella rhizophila]